MKRTLELIDQIIVIAEEKDKAWKALNQERHRSSQTLGDDSIIFHLRALKELVLEESLTIKPSSDTHDGHLPPKPFLN